MLGVVVVVVVMGNFGPSVRQEAQSWLVMGLPMFSRMRIEGEKHFDAQWKNRREKEVRDGKI